MAVVGNPPSITLDEILVASDFTAASDAALDYAQALAKHFGSRIAVANVVDLSIAARSTDAVTGLLVDEMRRRSAENVEGILSALKASGFRAEGRSLEAYNPAARIAQLAEERESSLLAVGTHGRRGMSKFILGSFAAEIIRSAKCPVLTIGPNAKPVNDSINIGTVLFATDLEHQTAEKAAVALAFAEDSLAKILLCHVVDHPTGNLTMTLEQQFTAESALKRLIPSAAYEWCDPEVDVEYGDPGARILRLAEKVGADLIVLGAHKASHRFPRFPEGVANSVIEKATCPVLTICSD